MVWRELRSSERDPRVGDRLFRKVLEMEPDASTKSWSLLYLGRLADSQGEREQAQRTIKRLSPWKARRIRSGKRRKRV